MACFYTIKYCHIPYCLGQVLYILEMHFKLQLKLSNVGLQETIGSHFVIFSEIFYSS